MLYTLNLAGNMAAATKRLSADLTQLQARARDTKVAVAAIGTSARAGLAGLGEHGGQAAEGALKAAAGFAALGFGVHSLLKDQQDYEQATARLIIQGQKLAKTLADTWGPTVANMIDRCTIGVAYLGNLIIGSVAPAVSMLASLFVNLGTVALSSLKAIALFKAGDFRGAAENVAAARDSMSAMVADVKKGFAEIDVARNTAFSAAFEAWKQQVDGIKDVVGGIKADYASIVTLISGVRPGGQAGYRADLVGAGGMMGKTSTAHISPTTRESVAAPEVVSAVDQTTAAIEGVGGGITSIVGMIPVYGQMLAAIWGAAKSIGTDSMAYADEIVSVLSGAGKQLAMTVSDVPMQIVNGLPDIATEIATSFPRLVLELVASVPKITIGIIKAIANLPHAIGWEFQKMVTHLWTEVKQAFEDLGNIFPVDPKKKAARQDRIRMATEAGVFGSASAQLAQISKMASGGDIGRSGLAFVHQGERITPAREVRQGGAQTNVSITLHAHGITDPDQLIRHMQKRLGTYGVGLSLEPRRGG